MVSRQDADRLRAFAIVGGLVLLAWPSFAWAQDSVQRPQGQQPAALVQSAQPVVALPPPETLLVLIRSTLLALAHANETGNYTVLRDLSAPAFQGANTAARLGTIFSDLRDRNIDLLVAAYVTPQIVGAPKLTDTGLLSMVGFLPGPPQQVNFEFIFQPVAGRWRLFGISVNPAPAAAGAASAPAIQPAADQPKKATQSSGKPK